MVRAPWRSRPSWPFKCQTRTRSIDGCPRRPRTGVSRLCGLVGSGGGLVRASSGDFAFPFLGFANAQSTGIPSGVAIRIQAELPEVAGVGGAIPVASIAGEVRAFRYFPRHSCRNRGRVHSRSSSCHDGVSRATRRPRGGADAPVCASATSRARAESDHRDEPKVWSGPVSAAETIASSVTTSPIRSASYRIRPSGATPVIIRLAAGAAIISPPATW
jgi:hypothetical protein